MLSGEIPTQLGNLTIMRSLYLNNNELQGKNPSSFGNLINLCQCDLSYNNLVGPIPPQLGNMGNLNSLRLINNGLEGGIPYSFTNLSELQECNLSYSTTILLDHHSHKLFELKMSKTRELLYLVLIWLACVRVCMRRGWVQ